MPPSATLRYVKRIANVLGSQMAYVEVGNGDPIVFLHGNPTSSYLWRNVIPHVERWGRCIAPDLVGMGDSDKLPDSGPGRYRIAEHSMYLDAFLEEVGVRNNVTLVIHDWGSALGFDWARRHPEAIKGIAYMEAIVRPLARDELGEHGVFLDALRGPDGEALILEQNLFIEEFLPRLVLRELGEVEMAEYRRPHAEPGEARRAMLTMPREIPIGGEPAETSEMVSRYSEWLSESRIPKLLVNALPGAAITGPMREFCQRWPNQTEVSVKGLHFVQEDSPDEIGQAVARWVRRL
ncbi:MAG: haloalkane dehalogenase [Deltaproteobacteria bacterium]|nr:haloalkane dehalogenase [Deltaproteobacteria bacterium]